MEKVKKVTLSGMLFAIGLILPFFIGQIPAVGKMLLPMHIPVLICGQILGWQYGLAVGFLLPLVRSVLFGMPVLYPNAIAMAFEMGTYGLVAGWLYSHAKWQRTKERYEEPGGNVDYKRFEQEVLVCRSKSAKRCSTAPIIRRNGASLRQQKSRRAASISWRERTPAMNGWKHTTI